MLFLTQRTENQRPITDWCYHHRRVKEKEVKALD